MGFWSVQGINRFEIFIIPPVLQIIFGYSYCFLYIADVPDASAGILQLNGAIHRRADILAAAHTIFLQSIFNILFYQQ